MQRDHIGAGQQFIEVDAVRLRRATWSVRDDHLHAEGRLAGARDGAAERTPADDAQDAAAQFADGVVQQPEARGARPGAVHSLARVLGEVVREVQQHAEHMLHDRGRAVIADVADRHATLARRREVDVVGAGGRETDDPQRPGPLDQLAVQADLVGQHHLAACDARRDLFGLGMCMQHESGRRRA